MIKLEITTHSDEAPEIVEVEEYDAQEVADMINTHERQVIVFGDNIYSKIDIKRIRKLEK